MEVIGYLIPLFLLAVVGGFIAVHNRKNGTEIGVTLRKDYGINQRFKK